MTKMIDYYNEMIADINQTQKPVHEMSKEVEQRIFTRVCFFCECGEIMMCREYTEDGIVEHFHCPDCERHYSTVANPETGEFKLYETGESWLESFCQHHQCP